MTDHILTEGYTAAKTGSDFMACPHPLGSDAAIQWMLGHWTWQMEKSGGIAFLTGGELKIK